jgi:predicted Zn-dependent protease
MVALREQKGGGNSFESFFSTHPATNERISYLQKLIQRSGYNRYAYEGISKHAQVRARVKQLLAEHKKDKDKDKDDESEQPQ